MAKEALKKAIVKKQNGICALTGIELPEVTSLYDTDRKKQKKDGGIYLIPNTRCVDPVAHMKRHENYRERDAIMDEIKSIMDDRRQVMKLGNGVNNQILAYSRGTDKLRADTVEWLNAQKKIYKKEMSKRDRLVTKAITALAEVDPFTNAALGVRAVGPITIASCHTYIDLSKARHASSLWSYVGLHKASHERYTKGESGGGNKTLRCVLYTMAESQMKLAGAYRTIYDQVKTRLSISEKIVKSRNTQGKLIECMWKDTKPSHRHGAALRAVCKHFLADYWYVGRTLAGLETSMLYPEAMLGGTHRTIMPEERGWIY